MKRVEEIKCQRKIQLRQDLQNQIISAHQEHQKLYESFLQEKFYLDEIAKRVAEELLEEGRLKRARKEQTKKEMEAFQLIKKELERIQQIEIEEENERIIKFCQQREMKLETEERRQKELEKNRKDLNVKMVLELTELIVSTEKHDED